MSSVLLVGASSTGHSHDRRGPTRDRRDHIQDSRSFRDRDRDRDHRQGGSHSSFSPSQQPLLPTPTREIPQEVQDNLQEGFYAPMIDFDNPLGSLDSITFDFERTCPETSPLFFKNVSRSGQKSTVCKHWLRNLCKKGKKCEYMHAYISDKMPSCRFFAETGLSFSPSPIPQLSKSSSSSLLLPFFIPVLFRLSRLTIASPCDLAAQTTIRKGRRLPLSDCASPGPQTRP